MCGIAGIVGFGAGDETSLVSSMITLLAHRGPDSSGVWYDIDATLGHCRLSIIDLTSAGRQPMQSADGRYHIIYNGEIYNYLELRDELIKWGYTFRTKTDTEVLLAAYDAWGDECLERLNGMWAFAIWDRQERKLFASRDRFGEKPFYYVHRGDRLYFASEMKALFLIPGLSRTPNPQAVIDFCAERISDHRERTFIEEIYQLSPASRLIWKDGHIKTGSYWSIPKGELHGWNRAMDYDLEEIRFLLDDAVRIRLRSDTPVGCLASGGLDSSVIASMMRKNFPQEQSIHLFTTLTEPLNQEAKGIEYLLNQRGIESHFHTPTAKLFWEDLPKLLWHQEQPFGDGSMAAHYALMREARDAGIPVLLTGQGGDEVFAGYPTHLWVYFGSKLRQMQWVHVLHCMREAYENQALSYHKIIVHALPRTLWAMARRIYIKQQLNWINWDFFSSIRGPDEYIGREADSLDDYLRNSMAYWTLPGFLHYEDRNSMAFGVETRLPFLDYRLVEKMFQVPPEEKLRGGQTKRILRDIARPIVPQPIVESLTKQSYPAPLALWIRCLEKEIREIAYSSILQECPILNAKRWRELMEGFLRNENNHLEPVWRGLICALWYEQVFGGNSQKVPTTPLSL